MGTKLQTTIVTEMPTLWSIPPWILVVSTFWSSPKNTYIWLHSKAVQAKAMHQLVGEGQLKCQKGQEEQLWLAQSHFGMHFWDFQYFCSTGVPKCRWFPMMLLLLWLFLCTHIPHHLSCKSWILAKAWISTSRNTPNSPHTNCWFWTPTLCTEDIFLIRDSLMKGGDFHNLSVSRLWYIQHENQGMQMEDTSASTTENTV